MSDQWPRGVVMAMAAAVATLVYAPTLGGFFTSDDFVLVERALGEGLFVAWGEDHGGFFRPLVGLLFELDGALWGLDPRGYRVTNLVLHAITGVLVGLLAARLGRGLGRDDLDAGRAQRVGWLAGAFFLFHPSHAEAVVWISGRADLAATLWQVAGLIAGFGYIDRGGRGRLGLALVALALALSAKESALPWPGVLVVLVVADAWSTPTDAARRASTIRRLGALMIGSMVVLGLYFSLRRAALGVWLGGYGTTDHLDFEAVAALRRLGRYTVRALLPGSTFTAEIAMAGLLLIAVVGTIAMFLQRRSLGRLWLGLAIAFGLSLSTALTVLDVDLASPRGERFLYWPTVFVCVALALAVVASLPRRRFATLLGAVLCLAGGTSLVLAQPAWRSAASTARQLTETGASSVPADTVVWLTHLPSEDRGRFVLHNGFGPALRLFAARPPRTAVPLVTVATRGPGLGASAKVEDITEGVRVTLELDEGAWIATSSLPADWQRDDVADGRTVVLSGSVPPGVALVSLDPALGGQVPDSALAPATEVVELPAHQSVKPTPACPAPVERGVGNHRAGLVVTFDDQTSEAYCLHFDDEPITGVQLLRRSELGLTVQSMAPMGVMICRLEGATASRGCAYPDEACFCASDPIRFWTLWQRVGETWAFSAAGAADIALRHGAVFGLRWGEGEGSGGPAACSFEQICPASAD